MSEALVQLLQEWRPRAVDAAWLENPALREQLLHQVVAFPAVVLPSRREPVALVGIVHRHGVGEAWMITGVGFEKRALQVMRRTRQLLEEGVDLLGLRRLHMLVDASRPEAGRWAELIGFVLEAGPLYGAGALGQDLNVYRYRGGKHGSDSRNGSNDDFGKRGLAAARRAGEDRPDGVAARGRAAAGAGSGDASAAAAG